MAGAGSRDSARRAGDTTLFRVARDVGFNARVEPFWHTFGRLKSRLGFFERRRERRRLERIVAGIRAGLRAEGADPQGWDEREGECVCNLRVARMGLVKEFKNYARGAADAGAGSEPWPHLFALRDRPCLLIPVEFARPLSVSPGGGEEPFPVASSLRARAELEEINARLRIDETFALRKMVDYLDATERDIAIYESRFGTSEGFWPKFTFVLLRKLCEASAAHRLPVLFA